ncbi:hypothetical protein [Mycobacterium leprae]|nr:hypothetical protein [Mycobacterium leprae]
MSAAIVIALGIVLLVATLADPTAVRDWVLQVVYTGLKSGITQVLYGT